jgi:ABC-2 type transport system permease protein
MVNPMFHMVNAFRYSYTGRGDAPLWVSLAAIVVLTAIFVAIALRMTAAGYKLRT